MKIGRNAASFEFYRDLKKVRTVQRFDAKRSADAARSSQSFQARHKKVPYKRGLFSELS
jgi:hypothetical protein